MTADTVPVMPPLDDDTARALTRAGKKAADATDARNQLIRAAIAAGGGVREVARAVGLNHATVLNIISPKKRRDPGRGAVTPKPKPQPDATPEVP